MVAVFPLHNAKNPSFRFTSTKNLSAALNEYGICLLINREHKRETKKTTKLMILVYVNQIYDIFGRFTLIISEIIRF